MSIFARQTFQDRRKTKNELPKLTARFWKINSEMLDNSDVMLVLQESLSTYLSIKPIKTVFMHFTSLQHVILIK